MENCFWGRVLSVSLELLDGLAGITVLSGIDRQEIRRCRLAPIRQHSPPPFPGNSEKVKGHYTLLALLTDEQKYVIITHDIDGITFSDIARNLHLTPQSVRQKYIRGINRLRSFLRKEAA
ncbi:RNA polymerase sigma factor [Phocaeicola sp.]|uniref:RNA polymerase sigma factor n=1 Tax=Phocaeicola sp. TaxID=2773926 RepID=UPI003AB7B24E